LKTLFLGKWHEDKTYYGNNVEPVIQRIEKIWGVELRTIPDERDMDYGICVGKDIRGWAIVREFPYTSRKHRAVPLNIFQFIQAQSIGVSTGFPCSFLAGFTDGAILVRNLADFDIVPCEWHDGPVVFLAIEDFRPIEKGGYEN
jgi:hypothetical protein